MSNYITKDWLNLRKEPVVFKENIITVMPPSTVVEMLAPTENTTFSKVKIRIGTDDIEGYAATEYLQATNLPLPSLPSNNIVIPAVNLAPNAGVVISKSSIEGRAYPINENGAYRVLLPATGDSAINTIHGALNYLDVENSARYAPTTTQTYCNIYAFDVVYSMSATDGTGPYIPRVWWNEHALADIKQGIMPPAIYEKTVLELNANSIADWFDNYGAGFKWVRYTDITALQEKINTGTIGIIVGQRINLNNPGHIVCVVPEIAGHAATRQEGKVLSPLQSQAGSVNRKYTTGNNWWLNQNRFRKFGMWAYNNE